MTGRLLLRRTWCAYAALAAIATPTGAAAAEPPPPEARSHAAATLSRCLEAHGRLSVIVLVDQSGSLNTTDPEGLRVGGLGAALLGLRRLAERLGSNGIVEVLLAGFYYKVVTYPAGGERPVWTELNEASIDGLLAEVRQFRDDPVRHNGRDTDYAAAMIRTRDLFRARTQELDASNERTPCKALIWFTDGAYQVQPRDDRKSAGLPRTTEYAPDLRLDRPHLPVDDNNGVKSVQERGRRLLCDRGGIMDDLVRDEVVKFTVALSTPEKPIDTRFLRALTSGATSGLCSQLTLRTGQYIPASAPTRLLFELSRLIGPPPSHGGTQPVCPRMRCPEGVSDFRLLEGLQRFVITADTGGDGVQVVIVDPTGREVRLTFGDRPTPLTHSGARITQWWLRKRQVVIEGLLPAGEPTWQGTWHLAFVDPAGKIVGPAQSTVQLDADLIPELVGQPELTRGETTRVSFRLVRRDKRGLAAKPLVEAARPTVSVSDSNGDGGPPVAPAGPEKGIYAADVRPPPSDEQRANLDIHVDFPGNADIAPIDQSFPLDVRLPEGYPLVSPDRLELPSISGEGSTSGTLRITGSKTSGGCVWITQPKTDAPPDAGAVGFDVEPRATTPASCLAVKPGEAKTLRVTFDPASKADGSVQSALPVHARSDDAQKDEPTTVPVSFELYPRSVPDTFWRAVALMVVGTLLPLVILHVLNLFYARFPPEHRVKHHPQDISYVPGRGFATPDGHPPETEFGKFEWLSLETGSRKRALSVDVLDLRTVASGSWTDRRIRLFRGPYGVVTAKERTIVAGGSAPLKELRGGRAHEVPLGLAGTWVFVVDEIHRDDDDVPVKVDGRLVLLIAADGDIDQGRDLERKASAALASHPWPAPEQQPDEPAPPSRIDRLRERVPWRSRKEPAGTGWTDDDW